MFEKEGRWDIHFLTCGFGCHHLTQVDISDSRRGFLTHVEHLMGCSGWHELDPTREKKTREQVLREARGITPITEHEARKRFEKKCPSTKGWSPEWHGPHTWVHPHDTGRTLDCYGFGHLREVPELPKSYYTPETQEDI